MPVSRGVVVWRPERHRPGILPLGNAAPRLGGWLGQLCELREELARNSAVAAPGESGRVSLRRVSSEWRQAGGRRQISWGVRAAI